MVEEEDDIFDKVKEIGKTSGAIPIYLREAGLKAPNKIGCYIIYLDGIKFVGRAEKGIRWLFVCLYNGALVDKSYIAKQVYKNRTKVKVSWVELRTKQECADTQAELIDRLKPQWNN